LELGVTLPVVHHSYAPGGNRILIVGYRTAFEFLIE